MELTVVDAFTDRPFTGNPAAIAIVEAFPSDERMQLVAREMNLAETAFVVARRDGEHDLRWFTPLLEVDLCGHATLAAAHVLGGDAAFHTRSGRLACTAQDGTIEMDFPSHPPTERALPFLPPGLAAPRWTGSALNYWFVELPTAADVADHVPDLGAVAALGDHALIITAPAPAGSGADVVSRMFAPIAGIPEDPVTGSAHCVLAPSWAPRLGRTEQVGHQVSARGGPVGMRLAGDRVVLGGRAVTVSEVRLLV
ncbi:MAG: PhzF family phenazine biosynthesis protein [Acidimicrobiia bacterium]